jgi:hypothetical protein
MRPGASHHAVDMKRLVLHCTMVIAVVVAGCGAPPKADAPQARASPPPRAAQSRPAATPVDPSTPILSADPCADRLHDICGALLLYYATNHDLPQKLDELARLPGFEHVKDFTCPASKLPYVYNPVGIVDLEKGTRVVIYDAAPSHRGTRWAISVVEPQGNEALVTKVVGMPESWFVLHPPK